MPSIGDQLSNTCAHGGIVCIQTTAPYNPGTIVTMLGIPCSIAKIPGQVFSRGKSEWRMFIDWDDIQDTFLQDLFVLEVLMDDFLKSYLERWHDSAVLQNGTFWQIWRVILKMESQSRGPASRNVIWCSASCTLCKNRKGKCRARLSPDLYLNGSLVLPSRTFSQEKYTPLVVAVGTSPHSIRENETPIQAYATLKKKSHWGEEFFKSL